MLASVARGTSYRYPVLRWVSKMHFIYRSCTPDISQRSTGYFVAVRVATLAMKNALQVHQMRTGYLVALPRATLAMKNENHIHSRFSKC